MTRSPLLFSLLHAVVLTLSALVLDPNSRVHATELFGVTNLSSSCPPGYNCDLSHPLYTIRAGNATAMENLRAELIDYVWKGKGFPTRLPDEMINIAVPTQFAAVASKARRYSIIMPLNASENGGGNFVSYGFHFFPKVSLSPPRLFIVQQGHGNDYLLNGCQAAIQFFLESGYEVLVFCMPASCGNLYPSWYNNNGLHDSMALVDTQLRSPIQFFLEPVAVSLNYALLEKPFAQLGMTGISGGGWTTTWYSALDPRIQISIPVAGSLPIYSVQAGDYEQKLTRSEFYQNTSSYLDLYLLGTYPNRQVIKVLAQYDSCCFSGLEYRNFDNLIRLMAFQGNASFDIFLDVSHRSHMISTAVINQIYTQHALRSDHSHRLLDDDGGYGYDGSLVGSFHARTSTVVNAGISGNSRSVPGPDATASWTFRYLSLVSFYEVYVTWVSSPVNSANVSYSLAGAWPVNSFWVSNVNQQVAPSGLQAMDASWTLLGTMQPTAQESILTATAIGSGSLSADAVYLLKVSPPAPSLFYTNPSPTPIPSPEMPPSPMITPTVTIQFPTYAPSPEPLTNRLSLSSTASSQWRAVSITFIILFIVALIALGVTGYLLFRLRRPSFRARYLAAESMYM